MNEKPQFYVQIWCLKPEEPLKANIDEQILRIVKLPKIYNNKEDIQKHTTDILDEYKEFCKQKGNREPRRGKIFDENEYREIIKGKPFTPPTIKKS